MAGAIAGYVDEHPETKLHWNVKNVVCNERARREREEKRRNERKGL